MIKLKDLELNSKTIMSTQNNGYMNPVIRLDRKKEIYAIGNIVYVFTPSQLRDLLKANLYPTLIETLEEKKNE